MTECIIEIEALTRKYRDKVALDGMELRVPSSGVFGIVGENGAGKTTTIKHILGLLKAQAGKVRVFGLDPVRHPERVLSRIGYLPEEPEFPGWMTVDDLMRYTRAFYPGWDAQYAGELIEAFHLPPGKKIRDLSKGQRSRAGLVAATAHRPELLLLDEPSSGLDPIVRRDILAAILRTVAEDRRAVVFSSHLLDEVEMVADDVAMISGGRLILAGPLHEMKAGHRVMKIRLRESRDVFPAVEGVLYSHGQGLQWRLLTAGGLEGMKSRLESMGAEISDQREASLNEIFVAYSGGNPLEIESRLS